MIRPQRRPCPPAELAHLILHHSTCASRPTCNLEDLYVAKHWRSSDGAYRLIEAVYAFRRVRPRKRLLAHPEVESRGTLPIRGSPLDIVRRVRHSFRPTAPRHESRLCTRESKEFTDEPDSFDPPSDRGTCRGAPRIGLAEYAVPTGVKGVSEERCKWPNTPSCGLARKGRYDRNTVGRESTTIEGSDGSALG
jgi:hypothetical protein